jgi:phosphatidate phosphatase APP1
MRPALVVACLACLTSSSSSDAGPVRQARVVVYDGWATANQLHVGGRVLEDHADVAADAGRGALANIADSLAALESDEVRHIDVRVQVGAAIYGATTDADGVFEVVVQTPTLGLPPGPVPVEVQLASPTWTAAPGRGLVHSFAAPGLVLVSDIDDTVVKTWVPDKLKMAATVLAKNAKQLEPVVGAAANYSAAGAAGVVAFFYLSGSPQNLYPRLRTFLDDHSFPGGPLFLKNLGDDKLLAHDEYKLSRLESIATALPGSRFVLVGDSGERDPEIYRTFQSRHPDRVVAVVIRKVPGSKHLEPARFAGFATVDDVYGSEQVIARLLPPLPSPPPPPRSVTPPASTNRTPSTQPTTTP